METQLIDEPIRGIEISELDDILPDSPDITPASLSQIQAMAKLDPEEASDMYFEARVLEREIYNK